MSFEFNPLGSLPSIIPNIPGILPPQGPGAPEVKQRTEAERVHGERMGGALQGILKALQDPNATQLDLTNMEQAVSAALAPPNALSPNHRYIVALRQTLALFNPAAGIAPIGVILESIRKNPLVSINNAQRLSGIKVVVSLFRSLDQQAPVVAELETKVSAEREQVRKRLDELRTNITEKAFASLVASVEALQKAASVPGNTLQNAEWALVEDQLRSYFALTGNGENLVRSFAALWPELQKQNKERVGQLQNLINQANLSAAPNSNSIEVTTNRFNAGMDTFLRRHLPNTPLLQMFGGNSGDPNARLERAIQTIGDYLRNFLADYLSTYQVANNRFINLETGARTLGRSLHWDIALRNEIRRRQLPMAVPPGDTGALYVALFGNVSPDDSTGAPFKWHALYDRAINLRRAGHRINLPTLALFDERPGQQANAQTALKAYEAMLTKLEQQPAPTPPAPPEVNKKEIEQTIKMLNSFFANNATEVNLNDLSESSSQNRFLTVRNQTARFYKDNGNFFVRVGTRDAIRLESETNASANTVRLVRPGSNNPEDLRIRVNDTSAENGIPLRTILDAVEADTKTNSTSNHANRFRVTAPQGQPQLYRA